MPRRTDNNQAEVMAGLRRHKASVSDTHDMGKGFPDILVQFHGHWVPMEIKSVGGCLTKAEWDWWRKMGVQPIVVHTVDEAISVLENVCDDD